MINYKSQFLIKLTVLLCTISLVFLPEQSDCDAVQTLEGVIEDEEFSKVINNYLEIVPTSHKARSHANRIIADSNPLISPVTTTTITTTTIVKKVTNVTINYSQKSYNNKLTKIIKIILALKLKKDQGCSECGPCLAPKECPEKCNDCKIPKCAPCILPRFCKYGKSDNVTKGLQCPLKPVCPSCPSDDKMALLTTQSPSPSTRPTVSMTPSPIGTTSKPIKPTTGKPTKPTTGKPTKPTTGKPTKPTTGKPTKPTTGKPTKPTTGKPTKPTTGKPTKPTTGKVTTGMPIKSTTLAPTNVPILSTSTKPTDDSKPPDYILEEVAELMEAEKEFNMTKTSSSEESSNTTTTSTTGGSPVTMIKKGEIVTTVAAKTTTGAPKSSRRKRAAPITMKPGNSSTGKPRSTTHVPTKPVKSLKKKVEIHKDSSSFEQNKTESHSDDGKGNTSHKMTDSMHKTSSQFHGVNLFYKHISALDINEATLEAIMEMIDNIPPTVGGEDSLLAQGILKKFGESEVKLMKKKGSSREFTVESARSKLMAILGHLLDRKARKDCKCPKCQICKCKLVPCTKNLPTNCPPCPITKDCIYPSGCKKYSPCSECIDNPDDDGPLKDLDDVDANDPIKPGELMKVIECKTGATCPKTANFTCGGAPLNPLTPNTKSSEYMVGGEDIKYGEYPQFVRLDIKVPGKISAGLCGGTLISRSHVLTAGHCVQIKEAKKNYTKFKPEHLTVFLGDHKRKEKDQFEIERKVSHITFSSKFNIPDEEGSRYDYAILTLNEPVKFNDHIQPACLPYEPFLIKHKTICYVVGIGVTKFDKVKGRHEFAKTVQKMRVRRTSCKSWGFRHDDRSRHCFTKATAKGDTCGGDSGGPVLCLGPKKRWYLMGMVSYGAETCDGSETTGWVAAYTRVNALLNIIKKDSLDQSPKNPI